MYMLLFIRGVTQVSVRVSLTHGHGEGNDRAMEAKVNLTRGHVIKHCHSAVVFGWPAPVLRLDTHGALTENATTDDRLFHGEGEPRNEEEASHPLQ